MTDTGTVRVVPRFFRSISFAGHAVTIGRNSALYLKLRALAFVVTPVMR